MPEILMKNNCKFDFHWVTGQYHYQNRGTKENLQHPNAIAGYESAEKFWRKIKEKNILKNERQP